MGVFDVLLNQEQKRLARQRSALCKGEFVNDIERSGGDAAAAALIWGHLQKWGVVEGFTPYPGDDFLKIYGIAEEELDQDLIMWVFGELKLSAPISKDAVAFGPIDTPRSLAAFVTYCRGLSTAP